MTESTIRDRIPVRRALVSVSDKTGLLELASALAEAGVVIVSTGSTAQRIAGAGFPVTEVSELTGFPESLGGRVKTLHPAIHAGILADLRDAGHGGELESLGIEPFELVVVNLYPFVETVAGGASPGEAVEQIDIGGPAMVRSAAKNHANVAVVVSPESYPQIGAALHSGGTTLAQRRRLAADAFAHTAAYDAAVAAYVAAEIATPALSSPQAPTPSPSSQMKAPGDATAGVPGGSDATAAGLPSFGTGSAGEGVLALQFSGGAALRYGENSHQEAMIYRSAQGRGLAQAQQLHGKEMSYNNFVDADAAVRAAYDFVEPAVAIIKHANPCGIAVAESIAAAHALAHACDPVSAFGGVIAANRPIDRAAAESIGGIFTEVVVAPGFTEEARLLLESRKNVRLLRLPGDYARDPLELRQISGGLLTQDPDTHFAPFAQWALAAGPEADAATRADLEFAWRAVRAVKSNGILLARSGASVGIGMGQVNRVDSCRLAVDRAGDRASGSVAASDAFFPFADGLQILLDAGVDAIVQPGGSIRDGEVVAAAESAGVTMFVTGERHFFH